MNPNDNLYGVFVYSKKAMSLVDEILNANPIRVVDVTEEVSDKGSARRIFFIDIPTFDRFFKHLQLEHILEKDDDYDWAFYATHSTEASPEKFRNAEVRMMEYNAQFLATIPETE